MIANKKTALRRQNLALVREYMMKNYNQPLTIEFLARMAGISPKYFVDLFKKTYGQSTMDYLTDLRINRAKQYLCETDYLHKDIAQMVGYNDEFYFSRQFKKKVGVSPSAFVQNPRKRIAAAAPSVLGYLLALGIIPVVAPLDTKWTPYYYNKFHLQIAEPLKLMEITQYCEWDKLFKSRPDVVIWEKAMPEQVVEKLKKSSLPLFMPSQELGWKEQLKQMASYLGKERQADWWIKTYDQRAKKAREILSERFGGESSLIVRIHGQSLHTYCNRGIRDVLCTDLNLNLSMSCLTAGLCHQEIRLKQLQEMDPDRLLLFVCSEASTRRYWLSLQHDSVWRGLRAVRKGHVYVLPSDPWFEYSAVAVSRMLDEMLLMFTGHCPTPLLDQVHGDVEQDDI